MSEEKPDKKKKVTQKKEHKFTSARLQLAQRYEAAWHKCYYDAPRWIQSVVIEEPHGRHANEIAHEAALLAENNSWQTKDIIPTGDGGKAYSKYD